ncbi:MAG TPA: NADPH dehydrogenase NamA [Clostridia bacterium]
MFIDKGFQIKDLHLKNRIVMPPMCMFSSDQTGLAQDFHKVHYASRAIGGVGLVIEEATAVTRSGRISDADLGIWEDAQIAGLSEITRLVHAGGAAAGIQLAHAGRKCGSVDTHILAPSAIRFDEKSRIPVAMTESDIAEVAAAFRAAAGRALEAGFDLIELHGAHGYLIHEFLSPLSNQRTDRYGGSTENRVRFLQDILDAVQTVWPAEKPIQLRLSASDFWGGGLDVEETVRIVNLVKARVDIFHISSGGVQQAPIKAFPGYQVGFSDAIRNTCHVPTIAVGLITTLEQAEEILGLGRADLVAMGRELLRDPYWLLRQKQLHQAMEIDVPEQYGRGFHIG